MIIPFNAQNIKNLKNMALLSCLAFLFLGLFIKPITQGQSKQTTASSYPEYVRYACIPSATAVILAYFGREPNYPEFFEEFRVRADGQTPAADVIQICERHSLHCKAYRGLSIHQIKDYLSNGFAVVLITFNMGRQHAISLFESNGDILATDLLRPLHLANMDNLQKTLSRGAVSIVIGENPVPYSNSITQHRNLLLAACVCVSIYVSVVFYKRRVLK